METLKQEEVKVAPEKQVKRPRKWPWVVVGILVLLLVIMLLLPVILSSRGFTRWVQAQISAQRRGPSQYPGSVGRLVSGRPHRWVQLSWRQRLDGR